MGSIPEAIHENAEQPVIIVGGGLAGLVAAHELTKRKVPVLIIDQENGHNLGGQAFWSLGGLFLVDSRNQRRLGVKDSRELAMHDWLTTARFDRDEDEDRWPRKWAKAFIDFATDECEDYVKDLGLGFVSTSWAERGDGRADGVGNSVPRFHLSWGTGPEVVRIFEQPVLAAAVEGLVQLKFRHIMNEIIVDEAGRAIGVRGNILADDNSARGVKSSRTVVDSFEIYGSAVLITTGGIGGNVDVVKKYWPVERMGGGKVPENFVVGVPHHVDGRGIDITENAGGRVINRDRMWHYTEGLQNWNPIWPDHGIRVIPGPSSLWLDANGTRLPGFLMPGTDSLATLKYICSTGYDYTWFILDQTILAREVALSGSEQNPDVTKKSILQSLGRIFSKKGTVPVQNFAKYGKDFVVRDNLTELVAGMNELAKQRDGPALDLDSVRKIVESRDSQMDNAYSKDAQAMMINNARSFFSDKLSRVVAPHRLLDPAHGPLVAIRMNLLTRKTLGGIETNLQSNVMKADGEPFVGLYSAGECAGFGGGGVHGYSALEGTFLGGCIFSGRAAGRGIADELLGEKEE